MLNDEQKRPGKGKKRKRPEETRRDLPRDVLRLISLFLKAPELVNFGNVSMETGGCIKHIRSCRESQRWVQMPSWNDMCNLLGVHFKDCDLVDVTSLANCRNMCSVVLSNCPQLGNLPLSSWPQLTILDLTASNPVDLNDLHFCKRLEKIILMGWSHLTDLSFLKDMHHLTYADLSECFALEDLRPLSTCESLTTLILNGSWLLDNEHLQGVFRIDSQLQALHLADCDAIENVASLSMFPKLHTLDLNACSELEDISALSSISKLEILNLGNCNQLSDLHVLEQLSLLQKLTLSQHVSLQRLPALAADDKYSSVHTLDLGDCGMLTDVSALAICNKLHTLNLSGCGLLSDLSALGSCNKLHTLNLSGCGQLSDISALGSCSSLHTLNLSGCCQVLNIPPGVVNRLYRFTPPTGELIVRN